MRTERLTERVTAGRIDVECHVCHMGANTPDNPFGRIMADTFKVQHRHGAQD